MSEKLDPDEAPAWLKTLQQIQSPRVIAGIDDDDCAVLHWGSEILILTTDFLNSRPIALELQLGNLSDLGRLNVLANLADLCGSGARPEAFMSAVTMPRDASQTDYEDFMRGVVDESNRWGIPLIGGDTKLGASMALLGIAIGSAKTPENLFLKNGAKAGNLVWVSGPLGGCNSAVVSLSAISGTSQLGEWAIDAILRPVLPLARSRQISEGKLGRGGIDISDGLGNDLHRLARASCVGLNIFAENIPVSTDTAAVADEIGVPPWALAFGAGGDMQFIVTAEPGASNEMELIGMTCIGEVLANSSKTLTVRGHAGELPAGGHRDGRRTTFAEEIRSLVRHVATSFSHGAGAP